MILAISVREAPNSRKKPAQPEELLHHKDGVQKGQGEEKGEKQLFQDSSVNYFSA